MDLPIDLQVIKYESVIHEFDPYFNYRVTQVLFFSNKNCPFFLNIYVFYSAVANNIKLCEQWIIGMFVGFSS